MNRDYVWNSNNNNNNKSKTESCWKREFPLISSLGRRSKPEVGGEVTDLGSPDRPLDPALLSAFSAYSNQKHKLDLEGLHSVSVDAIRVVVDK